MKFYRIKDIDGSYVNTFFILYIKIQEYITRHVLKNYIVIIFIQIVDIDSRSI